MIFKNETRELSREDEREKVKGEVYCADGQCHSMGGNDQEHEILMKILRDYDEGHLTADQAIRDAQAVPLNKIQR